MQIEDMLLRPIPMQTGARELQLGFRNYPLAIGLSNESLVSLDTYGIAGQSYYSRPNNATGEAVPGVEAKIYVRQSVAGRLAAINTALRHPHITALFGGPVELYVNEGLRSQSTQKLLFEDVFPKLIQTQYPGLSPKEEWWHWSYGDQMWAALTQAPHAFYDAIDIH